MDFHAWHLASASLIHIPPFWSCRLLPLHCFLFFSCYSFAFSANQCEMFCKFVKPKKPTKQQKPKAKFNSFAFGQLNFWWVSVELSVENALFIGEKGIAEVTGRARERERGEGIGKAGVPVAGVSFCAMCNNFCCVSFAAFRLHVSFHVRVCVCVRVCK